MVVRMVVQENWLKFQDIVTLTASTDIINNGDICIYAINLRHFMFCGGVLCVVWSDSGWNYNVLMYSVCWNLSQVALSEWEKYFIIHL
jgi:hypothetical protein